MYDLKNYKDKIKVINDKYKDITKDYENLDFVDSDIEDVKKQLEKYNPSIMFYGTYNSGKSSIINALSKENLAKVGDVPTTATIQNIKWKDFILVDTPGIVANDEHTKIAKDEIRKNDIILFVVDDMGTFENKEVTTAILEIIKHEKPILIVVNQKEDSEEGVYSKKISEQIIPKIKENIEKLAKKENYSNPLQKNNFLGIVAVNAQTVITAYENYEKGSDEFELLLKSSCIDDFISAIEKELNKFDGLKLLVTAIQILKDSTNKSVENLSKELKNNNEKEYYIALHDIELKKELLLKDIIISAKNEISIYERRLLNTLKNSEDITYISNELTQKLNYILETKTNDMNSKINNIFLNDLNIFSENIENSRFKNIELDFSKSDEKINTKIGKDFSVTIPSGISSFISSPIPIDIPTGVVIEVAKTILNEINNYINRKENEEKRRAKLLNSINEANRQIEENIGKIYEINNKLRTYILKLEEDFINVATKSINDSFKNVFDELEEIFDIQNYKENRINNDILLIKVLQEEINRIEVNIG